MRMELRPFSLSKFDLLLIKSIKFSVGDQLLQIEIDAPVSRIPPNQWWITQKKDKTREKVKKINKR